MAFVDGHDFNFAAIAQNAGGFGDLIDSVVSALEVNVGLYAIEEFAGGVVLPFLFGAEEDHHINRAEGREDTGAGRFVMDRAFRTFEDADGGIAV